MATSRGKVNTLDRPMQPLLRWAGGKRLLLPRLIEHLPSDVAERTYHEPFVGAGSLFFYLRPSRAFLADANAHLIDSYKYVRDYPEQVHRYLREHARLDCDKHYYQVREQYNKRAFSAAQAARFIYMNRTCFNGIFRVNKRGDFNVPYGWKASPVFPDLSQLRGASILLKRAKLKATTYDKTLDRVKKGDFVYLDPPYPPLNGTAYFTHYTADRFNQADQEQLARVVHELDRLGCFVMMTNADIPIITELYRGWVICSLQVVRYITCKSNKHKVRELIITNYR